MALQPNVITQVLEQLRRSDAAKVLHAHVLDLQRKGSACHSPDLPLPSTVEQQGAEALAREGYTSFTDVAGKERTGPIREAVTALIVAGLPGVLSFMLDEMWTLAEAVRARIGATLGAEYDLLDDGWAWSIAPGRGQGWPPHRGGGSSIFDRRAPELLTAWVALGDVAADQACMHIVPLDQDPNYPAALDRVDAPLQAVRALPVREGTALVWNANLLHWGGGCSATRARRVSTSFSFARAPIPGVSPMPPAPTLERRLAMVANQIATYGEGQPDVDPEILQWARIHRQLAALSPGP